MLFYPYIPVVLTSFYWTVGNIFFSDASLKLVLFFKETQIEYFSKRNEQ